jgi:hypothetical protein
VWVKAKNPAGISEYSPRGSGKPLGIPTLTVTAVGSALTVSWDAGVGADEYDVYCGINPTKPDTPIQTGITGTSTVITNLAYNQWYYIWVQAKNAYITTTSPYVLGSIGLVWYVSSTGNNTSNGLTSETALATVKQALEYTRTEYSNENYPKVPEATIIISGSITETYASGGMIEITGANAYPPIVLRGKSVTEKGMLDANQQSHVLYIGGNNKVTLGENLTITGGNSSHGGGVYIFSGIFNMSGGEISGNSTTGSGGGVYINSSTSIFTMSGGKISGNSTTGNGGGVYNGSGGTFTMTGGSISGNSASFGGGVSNYRGVFTMSGGEIFGNYASSSGGGLCNDSGAFTMSGGEICGNSAAYYGGGVYNYNSAPYTCTFRKTGGIIYGDTDTTHTAGSIENTAANDMGHAVWVNSNPVKRRNSTAGTGVMLYWATDGSSGWD